MRRPALSALAIALFFIAPAFAQDSTEDIANRINEKFGAEAAAAAEIQPQTLATLAAELPQEPATLNETDKNFNRAILDAAREARQTGKITHREFTRLRVAMLAPAFRQHVREMIVIQMALGAKNADSVPLNADGSVNQAAIDWDSIADFLERIIPLIIQLIEYIIGIGA